MADFWSLLKTAKSTNGANLLRIDCDTLLTPVEMAILARNAPAHGSDPDIISWLERRQFQSGTKMLTRPKRFARKVINDRMSLYTLGTPPTGKTLLIAFTGLGCMFMMPKSIFLQQFDAREWDILYIDAEPLGLRPTYDLAEVEPPKRVHYFEKGGLKNALAYISSKIKKSINLDAYTHVVSAGVSSGAAISMLLAVELNAKMGIGVGARLDAEEAFDEAKLHASTANTSLYSVYSNNYERDRISAQDLQDRFGATPIPIAGVKRHNPFKKVIRSGKMRRLLPRLFDPNRDPMETARSYASAIGLSDELD